MCLGTVYKESDDSVIFKNVSQMCIRDRPGDALLSINGQPVEDVFDYRYLMNDEFVTLLIRKRCV